MFANPSSLSSDFAREAAAPSLPPEVCFTKETNSENPQESTRELLVLLILDQLRLKKGLETRYRLRRLFKIDPPKAIPEHNKICPTGYSEGKIDLTQNTASDFICNMAQLFKHLVSRDVIRYVVAV